MKGFIACTLAIAPYFAKKNLKRPIHFSFTFDEETACQGTLILITELKKRNIKNVICVVGEPTNMKIIDAHKGCYEYTTHFEGLAGHGSAPDKGVNAVEYAVRYIDKLMELRNMLKNMAPKDSVFNPPYTTLQIGGISGGIARNVIADKCRVDWELRPVIKSDGEFVNKEMDKLVNENLEYRTVGIKILYNNFNSVTRSYSYKLPRSISGRAVNGKQSETGSAAKTTLEKWIQRVLENRDDPTIACQAHNELLKLLGQLSTDR